MQQPERGGGEPRPRAGRPANDEAGAAARRTSLRPTLGSVPAVGRKSMKCPATVSDGL
jgi:hypothetical protein